MIYLAQPYSHHDPAVRQHRYEQGMLLTAQLAASDAIVYAPIVHWHEVALRHDLPTDFAFWQRICLAMLGRSSQMLIAKLPGWKESVGVNAEREYAYSLGLPIDYINPPSMEKLDEKVAP
jgi:hypothetical protein